MKAHLVVGDVEVTIRDRRESRLHPELCEPRALRDGLVTVRAQRGGVTAWWEEEGVTQVTEYSRK